MPVLAAIPPILDQDRYILINAVSNVAMADVSFPIFGDETDIVIRVNGKVLSSSNWTFTSYSNIAISLLPLPITDGFITFTPVLIATVLSPLTIEIIGSWHPRQAIQPTASGITRREFNQITSTIYAALREFYRNSTKALIFSQSAVDGSGIFDALNGRISNVGKPISPSDAVRLSDMFAAITSVIAGGTAIAPQPWSFIGDGVTTVFNLPGVSLANNLGYIVTIDGIFQTATTHYNIDIVAQIITFDTAPPKQTNGLVIQYGYARPITSSTDFQVQITAWALTLPLLPPTGSGWYLNGHLLSFKPN